MTTLMLEEYIGSFDLLIRAIAERLALLRNEPLGSAHWRDAADVLRTIMEQGFKLEAPNR